LKGGDLHLRRVVCFPYQVHIYIVFL